MASSKLQPKIEDGRISHYDMAQYLMNKYSFKAMLDTGEVFFYYRKSGRYITNGIAVIEILTEKTLQKHQLTKQSNQRYVGEVIAHIKSMTYVPRTKFNSSKRYINLKNGRLDLRTMELIEHSPEFLSTIRIPVDYDASAKCPTIKKFLSEIVLKDNIPLLEEIFGWCLDVGSPIQRAILFVGEGANGKSTFLRLLRRFLGANRERL